MTPYEKTSLLLLSHISNGIAVQNSLIAKQNPSDIESIKITNELLKLAKVHSDSVTGMCHEDNSQK